MKPFSILILLASLITWLPARADAPEDRYLSIYNLVDQADTLNSSGKPGPALAKYREAQTALQSFQRSYPAWNVKVVSFRANYLAEQIAALSEKTGAPTGTGAATNTQAATSASATQVKLLDAGAEPRKVLRLHPKPGDNQTLDMTIKMTQDVKVGDMPSQAVKMPAMKLALDVTVKSLSADGNIAYEMVIGDATVADEPGIMPQVAEAMKSSVGGVKGRSGSGTVSNRGFSLGTEFKGPPGADPQARQAMDQLKDMFANLTVPLPEEAVGSGAKWEATIPLKSQGMTIIETGTFQLVSIEGERLGLKSAIAQHAANQKIQNPSMPGVKLDLNKMVGTGTANVSIDLAQLLPATVSIDSHVELSMGMNMGGQKQPMTMKMDLNLRLEAK